MNLKENNGFLSKGPAMMMFHRLLALLVLLVSLPAWAASSVEGLRMWPAPDNTRLVFDTSGPVEHSLFTLKSPHRLVIDIKGASMRASTEGLDFDRTLLSGIRTATHKKNDLRVVLDLKREVKPQSFVLRPNEKYGHRLVIDLQDMKGAQKVTRKTFSSVSASKKARDVVIAIDAGHGGDDPGAIGPRGTKEKDVVLAIARKLKKLVDREPGMRAVLIRDGDYFIRLKKRVELAREQHRADLFVSIHADSFRDGRARGSSVYTLSARGASSEHARMLAQKENDSDLIGGVSLEDKDNLLASVLLDLTQTATINESVDIASRVLSSLGGVGRLHKRDVEQAGFRVLKSPDLPSILVETAFISNRDEERKLRSSSYQQKVAKAVLAGVRGYFHTNPPPGTILASNKQRRHVISRGETLSEIAEQYQISLNTLRSVNNISGSNLRVGQVLQIPAGS